MGITFSNKYSKALLELSVRQLYIQCFSLITEFSPEMGEKRDGKEFARTSNYSVQIKIYTTCAASGKCLNLQESKYEEIPHPSNLVRPVSQETK